jgi:hypothetical protein
VSQMPPDPERVAVNGSRRVCGPFKLHDFVFDDLHIMPSHTSPPDACPKSNLPA